jgi:hypothetical protein
MNPLSPKRKRQIKEGTVKLAYGSTFSRKPHKPKQVMSIEELKASGLLTRASKTTKKPKTERAKWKAAAIKWFSEYIRLRDSGPDGYGTCVTCPRNARWRSMDAGHFQSCASESTRFDEKNVHLQCKGCNQWQGGKFRLHALAVDRKYGEGAAAALALRAGIKYRRGADGYMAIALEYKQRVDAIKANEPDKYYS